MSNRGPMELRLAGDSQQTRLERAEREVEALRTENAHWKANHDEQVAKKRRLGERYAEIRSALWALGAVRDTDHVAVRQDGRWHAIDCSFSEGFGDCDKRCRDARAALIQEERI